MALPVGKTPDVTSLLERLPGLEDEVILVGDCIVMLDGRGETDAGQIEHFVAALRAGCRSACETTA
jgi:hypothetical protein